MKFTITNLIPNQSNYSKFSNTYLNVIYTRKGLCLSKKMWLSAGYSAVVNNGLDS